MADHLTIDVDASGDACVIALSGELDLASAPELLSAAEPHVSGGRPVVIDLRSLAFIDSTGLGALAGLDRDAKRAQTQLSLIPGPPSVQRVFEVSGTTDAFGWAEPPPA